MIYTETIQMFAAEHVRSNRSVLCQYHDSTSETDNPGHQVK